MLKRLSPREQIELLTAEWEPRFRDAFLESVREVTSRITLRIVVERLEKGDIEGALDSLNVERAAFGKVSEIVPQAFNAGGNSLITNFPAVRDPAGHRAVLRFDVRDLAAEEWVRRHSATLVQGLSDEAIASARATIQIGLSKGKGPRAIALDLAGRVSRATKARVGGTIGLTVQQTRQLHEVRAILADPQRIREFFVEDRETGEWGPRYKTTPRRWDRQIAKAIREGRALTSADISKISAVHSNKMLELRAKTIARTETMEAIEASQHEGYRQTIDRLGLNPATDVEKEWIATSGTRTRDTHMALHGQKVTGLDTPFLSPSGAMMRHPGDRTLGAPASELINCRCHPVYRLRFERAQR